MLSNTLDIASQLVSTTVATYFLHLFVKLLMALLVGSRGKSSHINSNATFNSLVVLGFGCKLWYFSSVAPHTGLVSYTGKRERHMSVGCAADCGSSPGLGVDIQRFRYLGLARVGRRAQAPTERPWASCLPIIVCGEGNGKPPHSSHPQGRKSQ